MEPSQSQIRNHLEIEQLRDIVQQEIHRMSQRSTHPRRLLDEIIRSREHADHEAVDSVLKHLALCHSIIIDSRTNKMNSSSPDELALVQGTQKLGYAFLGKSIEGVITIRRETDLAELRY